MSGVQGLLPCQEIEALCDAGAVAPALPLTPDQVQPASLDLRLGRRAWRVRASFLPGPSRHVADRLRSVAMHAVDLRDGAVLERGCIYIVELAEALELPADVSARANPKSSTGRLDIFVRLITDRCSAFDDVEAGYAGPLYLEIAPQTFSVLAREGVRLNQMRFRRGGGGVERVLTLGVDLSRETIGWRARRHSGVVDLEKIEGHDPLDFFEPLRAHKGELLLDPGEFYILASKQPVQIGLQEAAEMAPIDPSVGEFRAHYAGFFDPGFGLIETGGDGSRAVLEVRCRETPFLLEDGQVIARLDYETLGARPSRLYGAAGSHYQRQGLRLSKHFRGL